MAKPKPATIYLDPRLHRALKHKAAAQDSSISDLASEAIRRSLAEDAIDLEAIEKRRQQKERDFESFVKELKADGLL